MPVFEPSVDTTSNQQLTAILVPVLVMLGGIGISYGIYTALRWFSLSRRRQPCHPAQTDTEAVVTNISGDGEKSETVALQRDARQHSQDSSSTLISASPALQLIHDARPLTTGYIGSDAIFARKTTTIKENVDDHSRVGKRVSPIFARAAAPPRNTHLVIANGASALTEGKENTNPFVPKQPSPLKNGYKPLVLGTAPVVIPRVPEPLVHPVHGYRYF